MSDGLPSQPPTANRETVIFHFIRRVFGTAVLALAPVLTSAQQPASFSVGVLPNVSARLIISAYQPLREHLQRELGGAVEISTARDFRAFHEQTLRGDHHLIVTAPNLGRVAQLDAGWVPLAMYEPGIPAILVAMADNKDNNPAQLRGKSLALANPQSLVALVGLQWLGNKGLVGGQDFKVVLTANDDSLGTVLRSGEAPLAIMSMGEFQAKSEAMRASLRVVQEITRLPGFLVMANPSMSPAQQQRIRALMLAFPQTDEGRRFLSLAGFRGIKEVGEAELKFLDDFNAQTRKGLGG